MLLGQDPYFEECSRETRTVIATGQRMGKENEKRRWGEWILVEYQSWKVR
jgi:hypothetical protein